MMICLPLRNTSQQDSAKGGRGGGAARGLRLGLGLTLNPMNPNE